ncbi:glycosyltransferase family 39 protein [bacterium]|nr:glycosyltransferase family 39 protein [bacterium]
MIGLGLRLFRLSYKPFWQDEGVTWFIGNGILSSDAHPGFYFFLLEKSLLYFGNNEFAGRLLSALCGSLMVLFMYYLVRFLFSHKAALLASLFVALSPYAIAVSQEMRMYSLIGLEFVLLLIAFWHVLPAKQEFRKTFFWWLLLFAVGLAGLNTHAILNFQLIFLSMVFVLFNWRHSPKRLVAWGITAVVWGLTYLPAFMHMASIADMRKHIWVKLLPGEIFINISFMLKSWIIMITGDLFGLYLLELKYVPLYLILPLFGSLLTLFVIAVFILIRYLKLPDDTIALQERRNVIVLLLLIAFNVLLFLSLEISSPNHLITLFVLMVLLTVFLLMRLRYFWRTIIIAILFPVLLVSYVNYHKAPNLYYDGVTWSTAGHFLTEKCNEDDIIIVFGNRNIFYTIKYYGGEIPCPMVYIKTVKWPEDPYQIAPDFERNPFTVKLVANYLENHPRVWCVAHERWARKLENSSEFKIEINRFKRPAVRLMLITKADP